MSAGLLLIRLEFFVSWASKNYRLRGLGKDIHAEK